MSADQQHNNDHQQQQQQQNEGDMEHRSPPVLAQDQIEAINQQVEYYLSPSNLRRDPFLVSQMTSKCLVPLDLVASFNRLKQISSGPEMVYEAIMYSPKLNLEWDENTQMWWVSSMAEGTTPTQATIVVRDAPVADQNELKQLLQQLTNEEIKSLAPTTSNRMTFFVNFRNAISATKALTDFAKAELPGGTTLRCHMKMSSGIGLLPGAPPPYYMPPPPSMMAPPAQRGGRGGRGGAPPMGPPPGWGMPPPPPPFGGPMMNPMMMMPNVQVHLGPPPTNNAPVPTTTTTSNAGGRGGAGGRGRRQGGNNESKK